MRVEILHSLNQAVQVEGDWFRAGFREIYSDVLPQFWRIKWKR